MPYTVPKESTVQKLLRVGRLVKDRGLSGASKAIFSNVVLKIKIHAKGADRVITLDGCSFELRDVPNTSMKLELLAGSYEKPERIAVQRHIQKHWPVVELGGCIGVVACVANKLLNDPHLHVVLEANPLVISHLQNNRDANRCSFKIINCALAYNTPTVALNPSEDYWGTSLYDRGVSKSQVNVPATQLRKIVEDAQFENFALVCDIEGQEYELIKNELDVLSKAEVIIMEVHPHILGEQKVSEMLSQLLDIGFKMIERSEAIVVLRKSK